MTIPEVIFYLLAMLVIGVWVIGVVACFIDGCEAIKKRAKKKRTLAIIMMVFLAACTQKPTSQAPVYVFNTTDNSQVIIGDNNDAESKPETKSEQAAEPVASAEAKQTESYMWLFYIITALLGLGAGYYLTKKWGL